MHSDTNIDYDALKRRGFLKQRQDGFFVLRTRAAGGLFTKEEIEKLAGLSARYGKGVLHATTRQGMEIPFIKAPDITEVEKLLGEAGIRTGVSGPCLRPVTSCPGNNWCKFGLIDTFSLSKKIEDELGLKCGMPLPHKFKIAISGCPNCCTRPHEAEIGIHGEGAGYAVYVGGCGGRKPRPGFKLDKAFDEKEVLLLIKNVVTFFKNKAKPRQRLALLIEEYGKENFLKEVLG